MMNTKIKKWLEKWIGIMLVTITIGAFLSMGIWVLYIIIQEIK